jgi:D-lactate dehydrogenase
MKSIAFFELKDWEEDYIKERLKGFKLLFFKEPLTKENIIRIKNIDSISIFIYTKLEKNLLDLLPELKAVFTRSTGFDHVDTKECENRKIKIHNVPTYGENTVAEHTFALILSLSRNIHKSYVRTTRNDFSIEGLTGFDLKGKTLGIIGGGKIGMQVARMAKGFGMKTLVYDMYKNDLLSELLNFNYIELDNLITQSDIITVHVPYNEKTHHLIDEKRIKNMKKGTIIINTARGGIIDTDALFEALEKKHLGGAGIDVIEGEELIKEEKALLHCTDESCGKWKQLIERNEKLFHMDNVVFTPHNAFNSKESLIRILDTTIENIKNTFEKKA